MNILKRFIIHFLAFAGFVFNENFTAIYTPAAFNTLYSKAVNGWSIYCAGSGTIGRFNGSAFYEDCGTTGSQMSKIYRSLEGYSIYRPTEISLSFSTYSDYGGSTDTGNSYVELSIGGDYTKTRLLGNKDQYTTVNFGGVALSAMHFTWPTGSRIALMVNGSTVAVHDNVLNFNAAYYLFLKISGLTIYYDWNQTGTPPSTYAHSYTASSLTELSNKLICGIASSAGNNMPRAVAVDNLKVKVY